MGGFYRPKGHADLHRAVGFSPCRARRFEIDGSKTAVTDEKHRWMCISACRDDGRKPPGNSMGRLTLCTRNSKQLAYGVSNRLSAPVRGQKSTLWISPRNSQSAPLSRATLRGLVRLTSPRRSMANWIGQHCGCEFIGNRSTSERKEITRFLRVPEVFHEPNPGQLSSKTDTSGHIEWVMMKSLEIFLFIWGPRRQFWEIPASAGRWCGRR